jgi:hypothetical protein
LENVDVFYGHLEHLGFVMTFWYILVHLLHCFGFGIMYQEKSGNPDRDQGDQMGQFSPIGWLFTLGSFSKSTEVHKQRNFL